MWIAEATGFGPRCCVAEDRFRHLISSSTYATDDVLVSVRGVDGDEVWIPERLWVRLRSIGQGYELHMLGVLRGQVEATVLNEQQAAGLLDELDFVHTVVADPALLEQIEAVRPVVARAAQVRSSEALTIEEP